MSLQSNSSSVDSRLAGGQTLRLPGSTRDAALHDQMYRYADDLQKLIERQSLLEAHNETLRQSCARLTENRVVLDQVIGRSRDIHIVTDIDGNIRHCNPAAAVIAPAMHLTGTALRERVLPSHRANFDTLSDRAQQAGSPGDEWELHLRRDDPDTGALIVSAQALLVERDGGVRSLHWILRDLTRLRETQFESQIASMVFNSAAEGVMITDLEGEILAVNPAFVRITGYSVEETTGRLSNMLRSGMHDAAFYAEMWHSLDEKGSWQGEIFNRRKSGEVYSEWLTISAARDDEGRILSYVAVFSDLSRILQTERRMAYLAHHDMLTGLPNRLLFQDRLTQNISQSRRSGQPFTLIFIDLDRFKQINDALGHETGDHVLREAAKRIQGSLRDMDTVARLGGDEFVILAPELSGAEDIGRICNKVIDALGQPIQVDAHELFIGGSLGCAEYPLHGADDVSLLKHADSAMYRAKARGGNTYVIHDQNGDGDDGTLRLSNDLRHALGRNQLRLEYQPQIATARATTVGVEALLRWDHPELGRVPPDRFIPIAEQNGLILPIGAWVLETACRQLAGWDAQGLPPLTIGVNIAPRQLRDPAIVDVVRQAIVASGIAPERLELEVTESEIMHHFETDRATLVALRELGVKIAIDDFGTGYSSLARLMHLPIDRIKLDRSFVRGIECGGDPRALAISAAVVRMGLALGVELVAEGVESEAQYDLLASQGCHVIQGYLTGTPMRPERLVAWFEADEQGHPAPPAEASGG